MLGLYICTKPVLNEMKYLHKCSQATQKIYFRISSITQLVRAAETASLTTSPPFPLR